MTIEQIVYGWKNEEYRLSLSSDEQALLPENPAGLIELSDEELHGADGGTGTPLSVFLTVSAISITYAISKLCPSDPAP